MDELEGTLRGHIGLMEEAHDRLEGRATEADRGRKCRHSPLLGVELVLSGMSTIQSVEEMGTNSAAHDIKSYSPQAKLSAHILERRRTYSRLPILGKQRRT